MTARPSRMRASGRRAAILCLVVWTAGILMVGILPLSNFVGHSHWEYIKWLPTGDDLRSPKYLLDIGTDLIGNAILFLPLGFLLSRLLMPSSWSTQLMAVAGIAGVLSLSIEWYQVYCHFRFPSIFDIITNVAGAVAGLYLSVTRPDVLSMLREPFTPIPPDHTRVP
ncbi:MAG TPA: VanZ family protein [Nitrospira sp.]|nr:VanZ family protein [Nitrospira sp.]